MSRNINKFGPADRIGKGNNKDVEVEQRRQTDSIVQYTGHHST